MGVPAFFRWLSKKYPSIVVHCVEEKSKVVDGVKVPVDSSQPNPNDVEFDNLYLDMNGIIHPCCHPEDRPAPKNEDEMMLLIFEFIDRIFSIVRPRKLLYMAIDGVAPRAKMNQQRSRRFRAAKESIEKREEMARIKADLQMKGARLPPEKEAAEHFDSNCITPGTPFMWKLAECLRYYVHDRLNSDPGWRNIKVILSDANVPGEGEHKIMDYIRRQRGQPDHDPNTHHCLCGADADLIMLGLATHEPHFTIIREEFKPNKPRPCDLCGQMGHELKECTGLPKEKSGEHDEIGAPAGQEQDYIFLRLNVLREYLERELKMTNLPFEQDMERAIDDWVFMCFFVGNDFLPHLPSLEIREGAIDRLVNLYKKAVYKTGGYITDSGFVHLDRVQLVLKGSEEWEQTLLQQTDLGEVEDQIFKNRRETELDFRRRAKEKRKRQRQWSNSNRPSFVPGGQYAPQRIGNAPSPIENPRHTAFQMRCQSIANYPSSRNDSNAQAATELKSMLTADGRNAAEKRKAPTQDEDSDPEPEDEVKLWEDGWKDRYYESKFDVGSDDLQFRYTVANAYVLGLSWVLRYYYQGCASWKWYFPYHYAPFASDFVNIGDLNIDFQKHTEPFKPLEQLMGVFPAASKQHLPITWQSLMFEPESEIIDFYPTNFKIDLNGKKYAWQGVALLPFVDEKRLWAALDAVYGDLTPGERARNVRGADRLFVGRHHKAYEFFLTLYEGDPLTDPIELDSSLTRGMRGTIWCDPSAVLKGGVVPAPVPGVEDIEDNGAICIQFKDPQYEEDFVFKSKLLEGARFDLQQFPQRPRPKIDYLLPQYRLVSQLTSIFPAVHSRVPQGWGYPPNPKNRTPRSLPDNPKILLKQMVYSFPDKVLKPGDMPVTQGYRPQLGFQRGSGYRGRGSFSTNVTQRHIRGGLGLLGQYSHTPPPADASYGGRQRQSQYGQQQHGRSAYRGGHGGGQGGGYNDNRSRGGSGGQYGGRGGQRGGRGGQYSSQRGQYGGQGGQYGGQGGQYGSRSSYQQRDSYQQGGQRSNYGSGNIESYSTRRDNSIESYSTRQGSYGSYSGGANSYSGGWRQENSYNSHGGNYSYGQQQRQDDRRPSYPKPQYQNRWNQ